MRGIRRGQIVLCHPDDEATGDVDQQYQDSGDRVAAYEVAGTVHGPVEACFAGHFGAPLAGLVLIDEPGIEAQLT